MAASPQIAFFGLIVVVLVAFASEWHRSVDVYTSPTDAAAGNSQAPPQDEPLRRRQMLQQIDGLMRQKRYARAGTLCYSMLDQPAARQDAPVLIRAAQVALFQQQELAAWYYTTLALRADPKVAGSTRQAEEYFTLDKTQREKEVAALESALADPKSASIELLRKFEGVPWVDSVRAARQSELASPMRAESHARYEKEVQALGLPAARRHEKSGIDLILVPAGTFTIGDEWGDGFDDERPTGSITVARPFYLGRTEVTVEQWRRVMGQGGSGDASVPITNVSYAEVEEFLRRAQLRLPTEAEWEYAAKAGCNFKYQLSNELADLDRVAWHEGNSAGVLHPVGTKEPNTWGFCDLLGNASEWCATWYRRDPGAGAHATEPAPSSGATRVLRGGSFTYASRPIRVTVRDRCEPSERGPAIGFRVALDP
jgi:formylglycine-generating enzyme required for sulfatase activity